MSKITKITKLENIEGFLQVDYFKGNKYIDKAGEFLNTLYTSREDAPSSLTMSPSGAEITFDNGKKRIEVNSNKVWVATFTPDTLEVHKQFFEKVFDNAVRLFEPATFSRLGWRNHYVTEDDIEKTSFFTKTDWYGGDFRELLIEKDFGDIKSNIRISRVINKETKANGLMFDIDLYRLFKETKDVTQVKSAINDIAKCFASDEMLTLINDALKNVNGK